MSKAPEAVVQAERDKLAEYKQKHTAVLQRAAELRTMRFVHIAGTNGKGSTAKYISAILTEAGYRCGCYTSPHLLHETERIRIDGIPIDVRWS